MSASLDWVELFGQQRKRKEYTQALLELKTGKLEAIATWLAVLELVSFLQTLESSKEDEQIKGERTSWIDYSSQIYTTTPERQSSTLRLPHSVAQSFESTLSSPSPLRTTIVDTVRAGLEYLSSSVPTPTSSASTSLLPLQDQIMFLSQKERLPDFPPPPSPTTRSSIMMASRQLNHDEAAQSVASILLSHYVFPTGEPFPSLSAQKHEECSEEEEEEDNPDTRSIQAGIKEARESIIRKEEKLLWLLGKDFHKGPSCRNSTNLSVPTTSTTGSTTSSSNATIRRPASTTPTASRIYQDESNSTIGALPQFPTSRSISEARDSVDSFAPSTIDSHHRHSRLISTSSSTAPLLSSARPSTTSTRDIPLTSSPHRRVLSSGTLPPSTNTYSLSRLHSTTRTETPPPLLQPLDSPSRPFAHLHDLPSPTSNNKRNSLDSAKDDLKYGRRESIPLDCQELSEKEKSELVRRNKKLERLLGTTRGNEWFAHTHQRRRWHSEESELTTTSAGDGFEGRRLARPVSITIPSLQLGTVQQQQQQQQPGQISPTTVIPPPLESDLSPTSNSTDSAFLPPPPPTQPVLMYRSSSSPPCSSSSTSPTSPFDSTSPSLDLHLVQSNSSSSTAAPSTLRPRNPPHQTSYTSSHSTSSSISIDAIDQEKRDERRRKLEKVRRVLGERVPLGLVVHAKPQLYDYEEHEHELASGKSSAVMMGKSKSRQMGERLREVFKTENLVQPGGGGRGGKKRASDLQDRENWVGTRSAPQLGVPEKRSSRLINAAAGVGGISGVEALTKARKLESLFGDLPPQALYLSPATPLAPSTARPSAPLLRHRRSHSDTGSASRSGSISTSSSSYGSARGSLDLDLCRTRSNSSSLNSYHRSIASLRYVMEQDPTAFEEVVRAYTGDSSPTRQQQQPNDSSEIENSSNSTTLPRTLPASTSSQAAVRKAQKLSSFFGTTKGEVWKQLLDDIASAVEEDEELEEEERKEVLESLGKLKEGAQQQQELVQA